MRVHRVHTFCEKVLAKDNFVRYSFTQVTTESV